MKQKKSAVFFGASPMSLTKRADDARMRNATFYTLLPSLHTQYAKPVKPSKAPA